LVVPEVICKTGRPCQWRLC